MSPLKKYEVILNGVNFLIPVNGDRKLMGFYVTRYVEASTPEQAETLAIELISASGKFDGIVLNKDDDPPRIFLESIYEIDSFDGLDTLEPGFGFYDDE